MLYDVIIPALNEETTVGSVVACFARHPMVNSVNVVVDDATTDHTWDVAEDAGARLWRCTDLSGKGQLVTWALSFTEMERVILSDADYVRISPHDIDMLTSRTIPDEHMRIIVPREPTRSEWAASNPPMVTIAGTGKKVPLPFHSINWAWVSGLRSFPMDMVKDGPAFHGYLLEVQLNKLAREKDYKVSLVPSSSLIAPLRFTERRLAAMEADRQWGLENGVLDG